MIAQDGIDARIDAQREDLERNWMTEIEKR